MAVILATREDKLTEDIWILKLVGGPSLDYHVPIHALAPACPGLDYIRLWPLPVTQPWKETPEPMPEWMPGGYARGSGPNALE